MRPFYFLALVALPVAVATSAPSRLDSQDGPAPLRASSPTPTRCTAGGHGGSSGRYDVLRERAFRYAFMLDAVGMSADAVP